MIALDPLLVFFMRAAALQILAVFVSARLPASQQKDKQENILKEAVYNEDTRF